MSLPPVLLVVPHGLPQSLFAPESAVSVLLRVAVSVLPVFAFLLVLIFFDSFKLLPWRAVLQSLGIGVLAAGASLLLNQSAFRLFQPELAWYSRYVAPVLEESCKAAFVIYLIKSSRVGFLVDSAIYGFAVGSAFAGVENIYYLHALSDPNLLLWILRGFGTAIMHGGTTAIFAILAKNAADRRTARRLPFWSVALLTAMVIHSFFNHFFLPPLLSTLVLLLVLPAVMVVVFQRSENATREWLEIGFDTDQELLDLINSGGISTTKIGIYLQSLRQTFAGEIVADMLCLLRLRLELSLKAKGMLLMREAGFTPVLDRETQNAFVELQYLEKSIGKIGLLAIKPFVNTESRELWQLQILGKS